jgi:hypothetical protein
MPTQDSATISLPQRGILCFKSALGLEERGTQVQENIIMADVKTILFQIQNGRGFRHTQANPKKHQV